jgi:two-component system cell cycle sensor histidine kinase/response regulator CckA
VRGDKGILEQVLVNFAVNARDAMPDGGTIRIATDRAEFTEADRARHPQSAPGRFARMTFRDTGTGIPEDAIDRIFEPFFTTKEPGRGTGLGLSVVYGIVQEHGGWIELSSKPGEGTVFEVYLPALDIAGLPGEPEESAALDLAGEGRKVLLVEDDAAVRNLASFLLTELGFDVEETAGVRAAKEAFARGGSFDLLFSDIVLPDGDGVDLADYAADRYPGTRILLTSGYPRNKDQFEKIRLARYAFVKKPFDTKDLVGTLRDALAGEPPAGPDEAASGGG